MRKARTFLFLGIWVAILPFLGFPYFWKNLLFVITGLWIISFGYKFYKESRPVKKEIFENFSENKFDTYEPQNRDDIA